MKITKDLYLAINKYAVIAAAIVYSIGVIIFGIMSIFVNPEQEVVLQPGIIFAMAAGLFCLLHHKYFIGRLKLAAHVWLVPLLIGCMTYSIPMQRGEADINFTLWLINTVISAVPFILLMTGQPTASPRGHTRQRARQSGVPISKT